MSPASAPDVIDLRSDTVTKPTAGMRAAIAEAPVGDDVYEEDPTVNALQERVATLLGKEAALFCATGSMCNEIAIHVHTRPGDEVICHRDSHPVHFEGGAPAALSSVLIRGLDGPGGIFGADDVRGALRADRPFFPRSGLLIVENTHNLGGGTVWPLEGLAAVAATAREAGLPVHLDGARLWNACAASGREPAEYAAHADTVSVCFSKGLGAPVGSVIAGDRATIHAARRARYRFGGAWRQAGVLAAAALYALDHHRGRLADDHANARRLREALAGVPGLKVAERVDTNILYVDIDEGGATAAEVASGLADRGVLVNATGPRTVRAVTHLDVDAGGIDRAAEAFGEVLGG